ncbi:TetR/AcrR family transcriptional regulator [Streptococcus iniae]
MAVDRRIQKTRKIIYEAFLEILNEKGYDQIRVQDIIDLANVGSSTFYQHYESKEVLLDQLCQELFHHIFYQEEDSSFKDYLVHIVMHFKKNKDRVASLLLSNNPYFLLHLKAELEHDVYPVLYQNYVKDKKIPEPFIHQFVVSSFIETLKWWLHQRDMISEEELITYYLQMITNN